MSNSQYYLSNRGRQSLSGQPLKKVSGTEDAIRQIMSALKGILTFHLTEFTHGSRLRLSLKKALNSRASKKPAPKKTIH